MIYALRAFAVYKRILRSNPFSIWSKARSAGGVGSSVASGPGPALAPVSPLPGAVWLTASVGVGTGVGASLPSLISTTGSKPMSPSQVM